MYETYKPMKMCTELTRFDQNKVLLQIEQSDSVSSIQH